MQSITDANNVKILSQSKILVVDDEEGIRDVLKMYLESDGYKVYTAKNGLEAMGILDEQEIDLIMLDLMMPIMNGWEFYEAISKSIHFDTPIIVITAYPDQLKSIIPQGVFSKPFNMDQMLESIQDLCKKSSRKQDEKR